MKKLFIFIIMLTLFIIINRKKLPLLSADIVISPGGYRGAYVLGICHYVKNNFNIKKKTFVGFSSGSFNSLFMVLDKEQDNKFLTLFFSIKKRKLYQLVEDIMEIIPENFETTQFDFSRLQAAVSTIKGLEYFNNFITLKDALMCCRCSSFIPMITSRELLMFYKNKLTLDGAIFYRDLIKVRDKKKLFIDSTMFGRYKRSRIEGVRTPKETIYQLYLNGYHDARKNHSYFEEYLTPL